jgi:raffinose/stachyose/melibiose transport system permease protein
MELMLKNKWIIFLFIAPALLIYTVVLFIPVLETIVTSFYEWNMFSVDKKFIGLNNFIMLFTRDSVFITSIKNTFLLMLMSVITQMPVAIILASILSTGVFGKKIFKTFYFVPNILSGAAIGLMWYFMYNSEFGLVNSFLKLIGLGSITRPWLGDENTVLWAIILVACWQFVGYHMILFLSAIEGIPDSVNESAIIDGAGRWRILWSITIPLIKPIIYVDAIMISTNSLKIFDLVYTLTAGQGGPNHASSVMALHMFTHAFRNYRFGYSSSSACVLLISCLIVTLLVNKIFKSESYT